MYLCSKRGGSYLAQPSSDQPSMFRPTCYLGRPNATGRSRVYFGTVLTNVRVPRGEQWEKVGNWTQGEKRGRVFGVLSAPLPLLAQEDP
eukprot:3149368-Pyramimonas_sp.AAC.1